MATGGGEARGWVGAEVRGLFRRTAPISGYLMISGYGFELRRGKLVSFFPLSPGWANESEGIRLVSTQLPSWQVLQIVPICSQSTSSLRTHHDINRPGFMGSGSAPLKKSSGKLLRNPFKHRWSQHRQQSKLFCKFLSDEISLTLSPLFFSKPFLGHEVS